MLKTQLSSAQVQEIAFEWMCSQLNRRERSLLEQVQSTSPPSSDNTQTTLYRAYSELAERIDKLIDYLPKGTLVILDSTGEVLTGPLVDDLVQHVLSRSDLHRLFPKLRDFWDADNTPTTKLKK